MVTGVSERKFSSSRSAPPSTARQLWLAFGLLTALLLIVGVAELMRLQSLRAEFDQLSDVARPRSAATRELEISSLAYALAVRAHLHHREPESRLDAAKAAAEVERQCLEYARYVQTGEQRRLATRFHVLWKRLHAQGQSLLDADAQPATEEIAKFSNNRIALVRFLDLEMQADAVASYEVRRDMSTRDWQLTVNSIVALLVVGVIVAVVTSVAVGKAVLRSESDLRQSEERYRALIDVSPQAVWTSRPDGCIDYFNQHWFDYSGFSMQQSEGAGWMQAIHSDHVESVAKAWSEAVASGKHYVAEIPFRRAADSMYRWHVSSGRPIKDEKGAIVKWIGVAIDIHDHRLARQLEDYRRQLEEANARLEVIASLDGLTRLKNRGAFQEKLAEEILRSTRFAAPLSLLLLDVDHFKPFNDAFGHPAGDGVLRGVAGLLAETARATDFVARYGGEEFVVLLPNTDQASALAAAERFRIAVEQGEWRERAITVSVGAATLTADGDGANLIQDADAALYHSKNSGRNCACHASELAVGV